MREEQGSGVGVGRVGEGNTKWGGFNLRVLLLLDDLYFLEPYYRDVLGLSY